MKQRIKIVGDGVFGTFLRDALEQYVEFHPLADTVILAVPQAAYEDAAKFHKNRHLVNICSVQSPTNEVCLKYSSRVTGLHPMFGPKTPEDYLRYALITHTSGEESEEIIELFQLAFSCEARRPIVNGKSLTGEAHDAIMRKTHLPVLLFGMLAQKIVDNAKNINPLFLPPSFRKLEEFAGQMSDMSAGTKQSIMSNNKTPKKT